MKRMSKVKELMMLTWERRVTRIALVNWILQALLRSKKRARVPS